MAQIEMVCRSVRASAVHLTQWTRKPFIPTLGCRALATLGVVLGLNTGCSPSKRVSEDDTRDDTSRVYTVMSIATSASHSASAKIESQPVRAQFEPQAPSLQAADRLIVPGVRVGPITRETSLDDLKRLFGAENVREVAVEVGEGHTVPGVRLFRKDCGSPLELTWQNEVSKRNPDAVYFSGKTCWATRDGITTGTTLDDLERLNGRPFQVSGFAWDYGGTIISWEGGTLEAALVANGGQLILRLSPTAEDVADSVRVALWDSNDHPSNNWAMRLVQPVACVGESCFVV